MCNFLNLFVRKILTQKNLVFYDMYANIRLYKHITSEYFKLIDISIVAALLHGFSYSS